MLFWLRRLDWCCSQCTHLSQLQPGFWSISCTGISEFSCPSISILSGFEWELWYLLYLPISQTLFSHEWWYQNYCSLLLFDLLSISGLKVISPLEEPSSLVAVTRTFWVYPWWWFREMKQEFGPLDSVSGHSCHMPPPNLLNWNWNHKCIIYIIIIIISSSGAGQSNF